MPQPASEKNAKTKKRKQRSPGWIGEMVRKHNNNPDPLTRFLRENVAALSFGVVCFALTMHVLGERRLELAYPVEQPDGQPTKYGFGTDDLYFMFVAVWSLTLARSVFVEVVARPLARWMGVEKSKNLVKFDDQAWQGTYYATAWITGFSIMFSHRDTWGFKVDQMTTSFPEYEVTGSMKLYYMLQCSFWLHAIIVHTVEMWRKDFVMFYAHHFITASLCVGSYFKGATRIGFFILVEQDFADIFLPIAKCLNYADIEPASTIAFASFAVAWIPTRHYLYNLFLLEIWNMDRGPESVAALSDGEYWGFFIFLSALQVLLCIWLKDLLMAIYKVIQPNHERMEDHRSSADED